MACLHGRHAQVVLLLARDEARDERAVRRLHHLGVGALLLGQRLHLVDDFLLALRRGDLEGVALEARRVLHVAAALGQQRDDLAVEPVDVFAHLGQVGAQRHVGRVGEAAQRRAVCLWFFFWHGSGFRSDK
jgi:hypothetical protein